MPVLFIPIITSSFWPYVFFLAIKGMRFKFEEEEEWLVSLLSLKYKSDQGKPIGVRPGEKWAGTPTGVLRARWSLPGGLQRAALLCTQESGGGRRALHPMAGVTVPFQDYW